MEASQVSQVKNDKTSAQLREQLESESSGARALIAGLFDEGTFAELGAYVRREATETDRLFGGGDDGDFEPVICGYGSVDGRLAYAFIQDASRMKGALSAAHAKKICDLLYKALGKGAPVVGVYASNGAVVTEGVAALSGYGQIIRALSDCKGEIPLVAIVDGICASTAAAAAEISDIVAVTETGSLYVAPPFLLKAKGDITSGTAAAAATSGQADITAKDGAEAISKVRALISKLPAYSGDEAVDVPTDDLNRLTPEIADLKPDSLDINEVIKAIADSGEFTELGDGYAPEMVTGIAVLGGRTVGIVANQPKENGGRITPKAAEKAVKLIDFCASFDIPLVTLTDTVGFDISAESESAGFASALASLGYAYATSTSSKVTAVIGPAYGGGYVLMGSKSLGADICIALDTAKIAPLAPNAAAEFLKGDKSKDEIRKLYAENISSPLNAARSGEIDEIVAPEELRQRIISAVEMLCD